MSHSHYLNTINNISVATDPISTGWITKRIVTLSSSLHRAFRRDI